jgi:hypothetical protein
LAPLPAASRPAHTGTAGHPRTAAPRRISGAPLKTLVRRHRKAVRQAARRAGGFVELHRNAKVTLLLDSEGDVVYRPAANPAAPAKRVRWWSHFRSRKLADIDDHALGQRLHARVLNVARDRERTPTRLERQRTREGSRGRTTTRTTADVSGTLKAILPDGKEAAPGMFGQLFHGTRKLRPEVVLRGGMPARGADRRLRQHAEPPPGHTGKSAFRGATAVVADPISRNGAAYWAGPGGWVYDIRGTPGWDVNAQLFGRVRLPGGGYRGNLMTAEQEIAIPGRIPPQWIKAYGKVVEDAGGKLRVERWVDNPGYQPPSQR